MLLLFRAQRISAELWRNNPVMRSSAEATVVTFTGMNVFRNLVGKHEMVCNELYRITKPQFHPLKAMNKPFIGIHVRLGDQPPTPTAPNDSLLVYRLPIEWYIKALQALRLAIGVELPAIVFSDGLDNELAGLLEIPYVTRSPYRVAISDLLALSKAAAIITSRSTFSLWGCYLGQAPSMWYPNKKDICGDGVIHAENARELEIEWMPGAGIPPGFARAVRQRSGI